MNDKEIEDSGYLDDGELLIKELKRLQAENAGLKARWEKLKEWANCQSCQCPCSILKEVEEMELESKTEEAVKG